MGSMKEWMFEQDERAINGAGIGFICPNPKCGSWVEVNCDIPAANLQAEKQSDIAQTEDFEVFCFECHEAYNGSITNDSAFLACEIDGHPNLDIEVDLPRWFYELDPYDEYLFDDIPEDPHSIFTSSMGELSNFAEQHCHSRLPTLESRMAIMQAWSTFETYLCDRLAMHLDQNRDAMTKFSEIDLSVKKIKINPATILSNGWSVGKVIITSVRDRLFHQFGPSGTPCNQSTGVPQWYRFGMQFDIIPDIKDLEKLRHFAAIRHDCTHRNGKTKDGKEHSDIKKSNVQEMLTLMESIAAHIEDEAAKKAAF